jgi:hypothetical protein
MTGCLLSKVCGGGRHGPLGFVGRGDGAADLQRDGDLPLADIEVDGCGRSSGGDGGRWAANHLLAR